LHRSISLSASAHGCLVPVSQASWEPRLLLTETIDSAVSANSGWFSARRSRALGARQGLRLTGRHWRQAIDATLPAVPGIAMIRTLWKRRVSLHGVRHGSVVDTALR
jgi:hypothetical protein